MLASKPAKGQLSYLAFGEENRGLLFAVCDGKIYVRKTKASGIAGKDTKGQGK
jgi:hypothetical protein